MHACIYTYVHGYVCMYMCMHMIGQGVGMVAGVGVGAGVHVHKLQSEACWSKYSYILHFDYLILFTCYAVRSWSLHGKHIML